MAGKGILLDDNNDLLIVNGSLVVGNSEMQEVGLIISMNQGELKSKPLLGCNLIQKVNQKISNTEVEQRVRVALAIDNKEYSLIKEKLKIELNVT